MIQRSYGGRLVQEGQGKSGGGVIRYLTSARHFLAADHHVVEAGAASEECLQMNGLDGSLKGSWRVDYT